VLLDTFSYVFCLRLYSSAKWKCIWVTRIPQKNHLIIVLFLHVALAFLTSEVHKVYGRWETEVSCWQKLCLAFFVLLCTSSSYSMRTVNIWLPLEVLLYFKLSILFFVASSWSVFVPFLFSLRASCEGPWAVLCFLVIIPRPVHLQCKQNRTYLVDHCEKKGKNKKRVWQSFLAKLLIMCFCTDLSRICACMSKFTMKHCTVPPRHIISGIPISRPSDISTLSPTFTHRAIVGLHDVGILKFVISQVKEHHWAGSLINPFGLDRPKGQEAGTTPDHKI